jgi:hypothetical protein
VPAWAQGARPSSATEQEKEDARAFFQTAMEAHNDKRFEEALAAFRGSYDKVASPNAHLMIVRTLASMGRNAEAYREAVLTRREAEQEAEVDEKYKQTVEAAQLEIDKLRPQIGLLTLQGTGGADPGATLTVAGNTVEQSDWSEPIAVEPGSVSVELTGRPAQQVDVAAGGDASIDLSPPVAEDAPPPAPKETETESFIVENRRIIAYAAGGVGVANLILYGVFGGLALKKHGDIKDQCDPNNVCPASLQGEADTGKTYRTMANVSFAIGLVGIAVGVGFFTWDLLDPKEEGASGDGEGGGDDPDELAARPQLIVGPGSFHLKVDF